MAEREFRTVLEDGDFFESPRWHDGRWWVSDFYRRTVWTLDGDGDARRVLVVDGRPSGLGWLPDGTLLVVSMTDQRVLCHADGETRVHADLAALATGHLNDMVVDAEGRAYVGNFGFDLMADEPPSPADLVLVEPDGSATVAADGLRFPNGTVITPDGTTLIVGESVGRRLTAFTVAADGTLHDRRVWADLGPTPEGHVRDARAGPSGIAPDGCCLDADGYVWVADAMGAGVFRVAPAGDVVDHIAGPDGLGVFACMLGGVDGRTLLLCCAPDFLEGRRAGAREAVLVTTTVEVPRDGRP